jgi:cobalt-zinc-cadmium efflux system outer membrane protein
MSLLIIAALVAGTAQAAPVPATPGLLPTPLVRTLLEQDPEVAAGRSGRDLLHQDADMQQASPYEWTAKLSTQRRTIEAGPRYKEWNAGLERTIRLPAKAGADRRIAGAMQEEGNARYGEALHETARELLTLWIDWASAEQAQALASQQVAASQENLSIVEKRVRAGDAARLDASVAQAELAEQRRAALEARTAANVTWAKLHARFPALPRDYAAVPTPVPLNADDAFWRARILSESDELKIAQAQLGRAQAQRERARAEKLPDPTVGVYTASEVGGRERITGVSLSMPIPGAHRSGRAARAVHAAEVSRQEVELKKRELEAEIGAAIASAQGAYEGWQAGEQGAAAMQDNRRLMQRAYSLGEADLQSLLAARRQAATAAQGALAAKAAAARAYYMLLVDAHLVWDLDHE